MKSLNSILWRGSHATAMIASSPFEWWFTPMDRWERLHLLLDSIPILRLWKCTGLLPPFWWGCSELKLLCLWTRTWKQTKLLIDSFPLTQKATISEILFSLLAVKTLPLQRHSRVGSMAKTVDTIFVRLTLNAVPAQIKIDTVSFSIGHHNFQSRSVL